MEIALVSAEIGPKAVSIEVEVSGLLGGEKEIIKKMVSHEQFLEMLPNFIGIKLVVQREEPKKEEVLVKQKRKYRRKQNGGKSKGEKEKKLSPEEELRKTVEREEKALEKEGYFKIGTIRSPEGRPKKTEANVYHKDDVFYGRSLLSERRKMYKLTRENYDKIMEIVNAEEEPQSYDYFREKIGEALDINPNTFFIWSCIARALGSIEEEYDAENKTTKIKPTRRESDIMELLNKH